MFHVSQGKTNERTNKIRFDRQKSQGGGGIGVKNCQFYLVKRQLRGGGQKSPIWDDIVCGRPLTLGLEICETIRWATNMFKICIYVINALERPQECLYKALI